MHDALILLFAIGLDAIIGDPPWLWRRFPHPVVWMGNAIGVADRWLNDPASANPRRLFGVITIALLIGASVLIGVGVTILFGLFGWVGAAPEVLIVAVFLAQRSLHEHVSAVALALRSRGVAGGRSAVAMIVGRDPQRLDESGVCRAAIESLAENFSDGIVAPIFWYAVGGLPLLVAYKMLNTADSMIGHLNDRYADFGWASARLDDFANLLPARLSAVLIAIAGGRRMLNVWHQVRMDARRHRSPNAGWPETAMATALGVALGGPRSYSGATLSEPWLNASGRAELTSVDIDAALRIYTRACVILASAVAAFVLWNL